jgi:glycopeptide antibiotics resistance protein
MMFYGCGRHPEFGFLQLNPFQSIKYFLSYHQIFSQKFLVNIVGNILVFIPYGWLGILDKRLIIFHFCSFFYFLDINDRTCTALHRKGTADIDDVFLNTFGMLIGYTALKLATWLNVANIKLELELGYENVNSYSYNR